jgi:lipopolysaccharide transport system ATP-binding protein
VLAVGDAQFQKKCLGKMEDVGKEGRTVIFVSHQMGTMTQLCNQGIYLQQGQVMKTGNINDVVASYVMSGASDLGFVEFPAKAHIPVSCRRLSITSLSGIESAEVDIRYPFCICMEYEVKSPVRNVELSVRILTADGRPVFTTSQSDCSPEKITERAVGFYKAVIEIPEMFLMPGSYALHIGIHEPMVQTYESYDSVLSFHVLETGTKIAKYSNQFPLMGVILKDIVWDDALVKSPAMVPLSV